MNWYWILGWIPSTFAIIGNGFVVYLICTRRNLRTVPNCFILSLAVADLGVGSCFFPAHFICHFLPSPSLRSVTDDIAVFMIYSSTTGLCMMAFDRYLAIVKSLTYTTLMTRRRALYLVASSWLVPLLAYFVPALCTSLNGCSINRKVTVVVWTTMFEFIPCVVLLLVTVKIITIARKHHQHFARIDSQLRYNQPIHKAQRTPNFSSARVIITVVAIFLICYSLEVYSSICHFTELCKLTDDLSHLVFLLVVINSAGNPIAYALFKRDIQTELRRKVCKITLSAATTEASTPLTKV